jgi:hypothetical protein
MRNIIISALTLFSLACSCYSLQPVAISQETGMSILSSITPNSTNQSEMNSSIKLNLTNQTETSRQSSNYGSGLWSWGSIPVGYELNKNGTLTRLTSEEWEPSI